MDPSVSVTIGGSSPLARRRSVQMAGIRDRVPSGSTSTSWSAPRRCVHAITRSSCPASGCPCRAILTAAGKPWRWVVCRVFL